MAKSVVIAGPVNREGRQVFVGSDHHARLGVDPRDCAIILSGTNTAAEVTTLFPGAMVLKPKANGKYAMPKPPTKVVVKAEEKAAKGKAKAPAAKAPAAAAKKAEPKKGRARGGAEEGPHRGEGRAPGCGLGDKVCVPLISIRYVSP